MRLLPPRLRSPRISSPRPAASKLAALALLPALALACRSDKPAATTRPSTPPVMTAEPRVPLVAQLIAQPAEIRVPRGPSTQPARPVTLNLTLIVTNTTADRVYRGESPTAAIARFALSSNGQPLWSSDEFAAQVITPVAIGPGQKLSYHAQVKIPDIRPYAGQVLEAHATFAPAALPATTRILVH